MRYLPTVILISLLLVVCFPLSHSSLPPQYSVTFTEHGLPAGMDWSVSEGGKTKTSTGNIIFLEQNGSYMFTVNPISGYRASRYSYEVNVTGKNVTENVYWGEVYYNVTFVESGLSSGTPWNVSVSGELKTSVTGTPVTIILRLNVIVNITFLMTGLPANDRWGVLINNTTYYSTNPFIYVDIRNGSYTYKIIMPSNYYSSPSFGKVSGNEFIFVNAYSYLPWEILIAFIVVIDVFIVFRIRRTRASLRKNMQK
jgi:hypothetical protein